MAKRAYAAFRCGDDSITFCPLSYIEKALADGLLGEKPVLLYILRATSWTAAMTEHHRRQKWEPYKPLVP